MVGQEFLWPIYMKARLLAKTSYTVSRMLHLGLPRDGRLFINGIKPNLGKQSKVREVVKVSKG